ncbi:MAG: NADH:ubiquinone oxidoreductase, rane subunit, partial [Verrucomicrobiales bacterium]|nr:NADH:ubiquinone oxidoreductase, rane subunit [Verrucomicrobiales bacterium]
AASIAVAQNDINRILAYSTVSQLGYMMMGLGVGGVSVGMFHLITHAFFKALLFLGAGSVIHGCHEEQDIRNMGGLRKYMPLTFATYAVGMMALCGVPLVFSGFWSKDAILHAAHHWEPSSIPFLLGVAGAFLTAFYMTRQVYYVFFKPANPALKHPHESPRVMTVPLAILAVFAIVLGAIGTPAWPWFQSFLSGEPAQVEFSKLGEATGLMLLSTAVVACGIGLSFLIYRRATNADPIAKSFPSVYRLLERKFFVDEFYEATVIRLNAVLSKTCAWFDDNIWGGLVSLVSNVVLLISNISRESDEKLVNNGFDEGCATVRDGAWLLSKIQNGQIQRYMRAIGLAMCLLVIVLLWGCS